MGPEIAQTVRVNRTSIMVLGVIAEYIVRPRRTPTESILYSVPIAGSLGRLINEYQACMAQ
jgi:hypothetical protein